MSDFLTKLQNQKPKILSLLAFGFRLENGKYLYTTRLLEDQFTLTVIVEQNGQFTTRLVDNDSGELYVLHEVASAQGAFVGRLREEFEAVLEKVSTCFEIDVFRSPQAKQVIQYVRREYRDELDFLRPKLPDNSIFRRPYTKKRYAVLLSIQKEKLGLAGTDRVEILDLRMDPAELADIIDKVCYFPGWHMNKKHWVTICLDGTVDIDEIYRRIDTSFDLAGK